MIGVDQQSCDLLKPSCGSERTCVRSANDWTSGGVEWGALASANTSRQLVLKFQELFQLVHDPNIGPWILAA